MPILNIEIVLHPAELSDPGLAAALAERAGAAFGAAPGTTWVRLHYLPAGQYAEDGGPAEEIAPVFVSVLKARLPPAEALPAEAARLAEAIAAVCGRPAENVHIIYEPAGAGRVAFGGRLLTG